MKPRRTIKLRLTLVYGALFLASGAGPLVITYLLVSHALPQTTMARTQTGPAGVGAGSGTGTGLELGDTFDALLARLEAAFSAQRQFAANASHELRTPLARQRTLIEVALADPQPSVLALQAVCGRVLAAGEQQERLIEALLTLARSQRGFSTGSRRSSGASMYW